MGVRIRGLNRSKDKPPTPPATRRLQGLPYDDVYLLAETSLMGAQQRLSEYRQMPREQRQAVLAWLRSEAETAVQAIYELSYRQE